MAKAADWAERVAQWRASGLSAPKFAEQHGIAANQLRQWAYELKKRGIKVAKKAEAPIQVRLLRLIPRQEARPAPSSQILSSGVRLSIDGAALELAIGFDESTLRRVLTVVKAATRAAQ
jgi:transcriptional regulator with XRE-family HTH domain